MSRESHCNVEAQCIEFGLHKSFSSLHMFSGNPIPPSFIISLNLRTTRKETKMKPSCLFKQIILTVCQAKPLWKKKKKLFPLLHFPPYQQSQFFAQSRGMTRILKKQICSAKSGSCSVDNMKIFWRRRNDQSGFKFSKLAKHAL